MLGVENVRFILTQMGCSFILSIFFPVISFGMGAAQSAVVSGVGKITKSVGADQRVRCALFPLNGAQTEIKPQVRKSSEQILKGKTTRLITEDGVGLDALWSTRRVSNPKAVILFHGNGSTLDDMVGYGMWYRQHGFSVLLVTARGHPGSEGDCVKSGEIGIYQDVKAAIQFVNQLKQIPMNRILLHGFSIGGVYAATGGYYFHLTTVLDHSFTNLVDEASYLAPSWLPKLLTQGVIDGAFPKGLVYSSTTHDSDIGPEKFVTDGLNNLGKLKEMYNDVFIFSGTDDTITPKEFSEELLNARYGRILEEGGEQLKELYYERIKLHYAEVPGEHCGEPFFEYSEPEQIFLNFLKEKNFI